MPLPAHHPRRPASYLEPVQTVKGYTYYSTTGAERRSEHPAVQRQLGRSPIPVLSAASPCLPVILELAGTEVTTSPAGVSSVQSVVGCRCRCRPEALLQTLVSLQTQRCRRCHRQVMQARTSFWDSCPLRCGGQAQSHSPRPCGPRLLPSPSLRLLSACCV